jgi:hypothetical protein
MFDLLLKSKQKREEKSAMAQQQQSSPAISKSGSHFLTGKLKTMITLAGIALVGYLLGQWYKSSSTRVATAPSPTPGCTADR